MRASKEVPAPASVARPVSEDPINNARLVRGLLFGLPISVLLWLLLAVLARVAF